MLWRSLWMALAISLAASAAALTDDRAQSAPDFTMPLREGRLLVGHLLAKTAERLGVEHLAPIDAIEWSIDVRSLTGRMQVAALERLTGGALDVTVETDRVEVRIDEPRLNDLLARRGHTLQRWLADLAKFDPARAGERYGLTFITADDARAPASALTPAMRRRVVMLVHGLDDPGMMWTDIIPALHEAGFTVGRFDYPDDGPISDSADLLALCLQQARDVGIERVDVVAHSMGGLVVRDVLTRPSYYAGDGSATASGQRYPAIDRLIMCGTPNHGSNMARLRGVIELRQHLLTAIATGQRLQDLSLADGNGEAGVDLLPNSDSLRRLNGRPLATHTKHTIIAARLSPVDGERVASLVERVRSAAASRAAPQWLRDGAGTKAAKLIERLADDAVENLGDGCVSVESTKLPGVDDFVVTRAGHLSMILNVGGRRGQPPAINLILDRLSQPAD